MRSVLAILFLAIAVLLIGSVEVRAQAQNSAPVATEAGPSSTSVRASDRYTEFDPILRTLLDAIGALEILASVGYAIFLFIHQTKDHRNTTIGKVMAVGLGATIAAKLEPAVHVSEAVASALPDNSALIILIFVVGTYGVFAGGAWVLKVVRDIIMEGVCIVVLSIVAMETLRWLLEILGGAIGNDYLKADMLVGIEIGGVCYLAFWFLRRGNAEPST